MFFKTFKNSVFKSAPRHFSRRLGLVVFMLLGLIVAVPGTTLASTTVEYPVPTPDSNLYKITSGPDGNLWFTERDANKIGKITLDGIITEYSIPTPNSNTYGITAGLDGNLWFTESLGNNIGKITPAGVITEYPLPTTNSQPVGITTGPDGNLWFTEYFGNGNKIGKITITGVVTEYPIPTINSGPSSIVTGPDGNLWFTEAEKGQIGKITLAGAITEYPLSNFLGYPSNITSGPDGNLWFAEGVTNKIGKITTGGILTEYPLANISFPFGMTNGPDGNLWFTESYLDKIGKITPSGGITEYPITTSSSGPVGLGNITLGPDGNLWYLEYFSNKIAKLTPDKPTLSPADIVAQLRVSPDRSASTDPTTEISYSLSIKNIGQGTARSLSLRFPIDPNLSVGYATDFSSSGIWVSAVVTDGTQPYVQVTLPDLEGNNSALSLRLVFRPAATAQPGATISTRYEVRYDDEVASGRTVSSNAEHLSFSSEGSRDDTGGAVQAFSPATATVASGEKVSLSGDFFIPNETVSLWYTDKDGVSVALGQQIADKDGKLSFEFTAVSGLKAGESYSVVGYGNRSGISGNCIVTIS